MLSVQSPLQLAMSDDTVNVYDDGGHAAWNAWRAHTNLPTPPSSDPPRRLGATKQHIIDYGHHQWSNSGNSVQAGHEEYLTLPPITHLDRHWPSSSPLTPPDDDMRASPLPLSNWRDAKPGPSRGHSPMTTTTSPFLASPSPSPVDEYDHYEERYDAVDEYDSGNPEWEWDTRQRQDRCVEVGGLHGAKDCCEGSDQEAQLPSPDNNGSGTSSAADWVTNPSQLSAHFIAEKTCEMVCYLWFSSSLGPAASRARRERERSQWRRAKDTSYSHSPHFASRPLSNASTAALQFCASPEFVAFMGKLLTTTQVSQSVIVLSLHYIFRLKERNDFTLGKPGSEFRVAVCALMLANKFVDDNTYTNKTWSEVSAIPLEELNKMEREFLLGIGFQLFVDAQTYDTWLNLLKGLVLTKEREYNRWRERRRTRKVLPPRISVSDTGEQQRRERHQQRARSTSPHHTRNYAYAPAYPFTFSVPSTSGANLQATTHAEAHSYSVQTSPNRPISSKRTAADAFSPTSATFGGAMRGGKRPTGLALDIPAALASTPFANRNRNACERAGSVSAHPTYTYSDSLRRLENMSLSTPADQQTRLALRDGDCPTEEPASQDSQEQTLAAPYRGVDAARRPLPPHLYFYALASSPLASSYAAQAPTQAPGNESAIGELLIAKESMDAVTAGAERKARLRYADSQAVRGDVYDHTAYGYGHAAAQSQSAYTFPAPITTPPDSYAATQTYTHNPAPVAQHYCGHQHPHHLPPLNVALSMHAAPSRGQFAQAQSTCMSPLPGFASLDTCPLPVASSYEYLQTQVRPQERANIPSVQSPYGAQVRSENSYVRSTPPNPAPGMEEAWSAPPSETVDGVYVPLPRHVHPHPSATMMQYQYSHPPRIQLPTPYRSCVPPAYSYPPQQQDSRQTVASGVSCASHDQSLPERAAFANAGPPGVAHFYPYMRSGSISGADGYKEAYGTASNSNAGKPVHHSHSTTASPEGPYIFSHEYSMRGRRL